jgi:predicted phage tail protein
MDHYEPVEGGWAVAVGGAGGGGGKGGGKESPDTLRSRAQSSVVAILSEGEVQGFEEGVDPLTKVFLDDVPIKNANGDYNFEIKQITTYSEEEASGKLPGSSGAAGKSAPSSFSRTSFTSLQDSQQQKQTQVIDSLVIDYRIGSQDQSVMPSFEDVRVEQSIGARVTQAAGTVTRVTTSNDFDRIRLRIGVASLTRTDDEGNTKGTKVEFTIRIRPEGGSVIVNENKIIEGKSRGPVDFEYEYKLTGNGPWVVSVTRLTGDSGSVKVNDDLIWRAIVGIFDESYRYPNTALMGLKVGAENFTSVPQLSVELLGLKIKIPSNYNPKTRTYSGIWDGTFKTEFSDNPAWVFYDMLTNPRYGCGQFISESNVDRYSLLPIAQYCDEMVPDGKGGMEPRLAFNAYITERGEAYEVLNALSSAFRGMLYFSEGTVVAIQDKPKPITKVFSPANVVQKNGEDGEMTEPPFVYEGTARKARKTVALVSWNDPEDRYKAKIEYVEDRQGLIRYGYHEKEVRGFGITSQGQAQRLGRWILLSDQLETETVSFKVGSEGVFLLPGEIIGVADPAKGGKRYGGRLIGGGLSDVIIDQDFDFLLASTYQFSVLNASGVVETRNVVGASGTTNSFPIAPPFAVEPVVGAPWVLQENNESVRLFRVTAVNEDEGVLSVFATLYDEQKFLQTDSATNLGIKNSPTVTTMGASPVTASSIVFGETV